MKLLLVPRLMVALGAATLGVAFALSPLGGSAQVQQAVANVRDLQGNSVGTVTFTQTDAGVLVFADLSGLPPGFHGFHIHVNPVCEAADGFQSAGGHWNLGNAEAMMTVPEMPGMPYMGHTGDLTNLYVMANGSGSLALRVEKFTVNDLLAGGHSIMVHADPDNFTNIPPRYGVTPDDSTRDTGDAGARIACGVIEPAPSGS